MIELSIPQPGEETRNAKDLIFTILTKEGQLTYMEITNRIKKSYNVGLTYQAIRKAVDKLYNQGLLKKEDRKYSISKEWVLKLKTFFDVLLTSYDSGKIVHKFTDELKKENYAVYTFNTIFELDNFWSSMLEYLADNLKPEEERLSFNYGHYTWWNLINLGKETELHKQYKKLKIKTYYLWLRDLPLNRWSAELSNSSGHKTIVKEIPDIDDLVAVNTVGDTVLQVKYSRKIVDKIKAFFEKYKSVQEMSMKEITEIAHSQCEIKFIMFRNPTIAKNINDTYLKYFK